MTFDDLMKLGPVTLRNMNARGGENSTGCTLCTDCTSCTDCWGVEGGRDLRYVAFGVPLTAEQWIHFLKKMNEGTS